MFFRKEKFFNEFCVELDCGGCFVLIELSLSGRKIFYDYHIGCDVKQGWTVVAISIGWEVIKYSFIGQPSNNHFNKGKFKLSM